MSELNIPKSWAEIKFGKIFEVRRGASPRPVGDPKFFGDGGVGWLRIADVTREGKVIRSTKDTLTKAGVEKSVLIQPGELVLTNSGTVGVPCFAGIPLCVHDGFLAFPNPPKEINLEYLYWFFLSYRAEIQKKAKVGTQANLNTEIMREVPFVIPPRREQERIVKKIESCFAKIDETEQHLTKVETLLSRYRESLLAKAFRGELVPQDPNDKPASVLLSKIRKEREANQKGKQKLEFAPISDDEKPFEIPKYWEWVRLGGIAEEITDYVANGSFESLRLNTNVLDKKSFAYYVRLTDLRQGIGHQSQKYVDKRTYDFLQKSSLFGGEILLANVGANFGYSEIMPKVNVPATIAPNMLLIRSGQYLSNEYLNFYFHSAFGRSLFNLMVSKTAQPKFNKTDLRKIIIPFPCLELQIRIVCQLTKKLHEANNLLSSLKEKKKKLQRLRDSVLSNAFEGRLVNQIDSEGTGHELLQKILAEKQSEKPAAKKTSKKATNKKSKKVK